MIDTIKRRLIMSTQKKILHRVFIEKMRITNEPVTNKDTTIGATFFLDKNEALDFFENYTIDLQEKISNYPEKYISYKTIPTEKEYDFMMEYTPIDGSPTIVERVYYDGSYEMTR